MNTQNDSATNDASEPLAQVDAGYENLTVVCPRCGRRNVYNRAEDIGNFDAIANREVACEHCRAAFCIGGDLVNASHELLLLDSTDFLNQKRYVQAVLSAATAHEVFFNHFLLVELVFRPIRRDRVHARDIDEIAWLNGNTAELRDKLEKFTFWPMQHAFLGLILRDTPIKTLAEAESYIRALPNNARKVEKVERSAVEGLSDEKVRGYLLRMYDSKVAELRNNIVHKTAYRPAHVETRTVVEDARYAIFNLTSHFGLGDVNYHLNESI